MSQNDKLAERGYVSWIQVTQDKRLGDAPVTQVTLGDGREDSQRRRD